MTIEEIALTYAVAPRTIRTAAVNMSWRKVGGRFTGHRTAALYAPEDVEATAKARGWVRR